MGLCLKVPYEAVGKRIAVKSRVVAVSESLYVLCIAARSKPSRQCFLTPEWTPAGYAIRLRCKSGLYIAIVDIDGR